MKKFYWLMPVILLIIVGCSGYLAIEDPYYPGSGGVYHNPGHHEYYPGEGISYFYNYLAPHGNWIELSPFGYVWIPRHMGYRWRPYTDGRWAWTDYGWTWISDLPWGDIPFHYGRWGWDDDIGWFWVPGNVWGPAWVTYRMNDLYIGWAPLPPGLEFSVGMDFNSRYVDIPFHFWVFIEGPRFHEHRLNRHVLPFERNRTIVKYAPFHNNIRLRDNRAINEGIDIDAVRRITRRDVVRYRVKDSLKPGPPGIQGDEIRLFRSEIRRAEAEKPKEYLNREEARQKLPPVKIWEHQMPQPVKKDESVIRRRQDEEQKLLKKSQREEIIDMQRKRADEEKRIRDAAEKEKVRKNYENRISDLKKSHEAERQEIQTRHSKDKKQVREQDAKKKKDKKD